MISTSEYLHHAWKEREVGNENMKRYIVDLAHKAIEFAKRDEQPRDAEFAMYLRNRILNRLQEGKSFDCDEYRALCRLAFLK